MRSEMIASGTPVLSAGSRRIGKVDEVVTLDDGTLDAVVTKSGMLWFTHRRVVPAGWIREVRSSEIRLTVPKQKVIIEAEEPTTSIAQRPPGR
jgi:hypothetical protein